MHQKMKKSIESRKGKQSKMESVLKMYEQRIEKFHIEVEGLKTKLMFYQHYEQALVKREKEFDVGGYAQKSPSKKQAQRKQLIGQHPYLESAEVDSIFLLLGEIDALKQLSEEKTTEISGLRVANERQDYLLDTKQTELSQLEASSKQYKQENKRLMKEIESTELDRE